MREVIYDDSEICVYVVPFERPVRARSTRMRTTYVPRVAIKKWDLDTAIGVAWNTQVEAAAFAQSWINERLK